MTVRVSCPYCNTNLTLTSNPVGGRAQCPRCGESFPVQLEGDDSPDHSAIPEMSRNGDHLPVSPGVPEPPPVADSSPSLSGIVIALSMAILVVGLLIVYRPWGGPLSSPSSATVPQRELVTMPPAGIAGLAYLPTDTSIVLAVQPGPVLAYCGRTKTEPRELLSHLGVPETVFASLDQYGVPLNLIDQLVIGVMMDADNALPRGLAVLKLNRPLQDEAPFLRALKANRITVPDGSTRFQITLREIPAEMVRLNEATYLLATEGKDLDAADALTGRGAKHLSASLRESMSRLSPASVAWAATSSQKWAENAAVKTFATILKKPEFPNQLAPYHAGVIGVSLEPEPRVALAVKTADEQTVSKLEGVFVKLFRGREPMISSGKEWVGVDVGFDPKTGLTNLLDELKK